MKFLHLPLLAALLLPACAQAAAEPLYANDFSAVEAGQIPKDFLVIAGSFTVQEAGGNKVLELPGAPLDTFGLLFGPTQKEGVSVTAKFFGTAKGRKLPAFGLSLNGGGGYRLQVSAAKKTLEIFKGEEAKISVPFIWTSGQWMNLRLQLRKTPEGGWKVEGRAWPAGGPEPAEWAIALEEKEPPVAGRAGLWGSSYAGTPIQFDDLLVEPLP